jgi:ASC-1-like (ASCH) protein
MIHKISINSPWFEYVKEGKKVYEGRCFWKSVLDYKIGDILIVSHHTDKTIRSFEVVIDEILKFKTFRDALTELPIDRILPSITNVDEGVEIYHKFVSEQTQEKYGVCMIKIHIK